MCEPVGLSTGEIERMTIPDAAALLQLCGSSATEDELRANIEAGSPVNADGTISIAAYLAWLIKVRKK